nr:copper homeostasis membrane protein CopD [Rhizobium halophytocola]
MGRVAIDTALMLLWGCTGFLSTVTPPALRPVLARRVAGISALCTMMLAAGVVAIVPAQIAVVTADWHATVDPQTLWSFLMLTSGGRVWDVLAGGSLLLGLVRWLQPRRHALVTVLAGCCLASLSLTGHAAMTTGLVGALHAGVDIVHVLSAGAWLGGLVAFVFVMAATHDVAQRPHALVALSRFSTLGHVAVALAIFSGVANILLVLGHLPTNLQSPYQTKLLVKIGLVVIMTLAAIVNRYVFVPLLRRRRRFAETALLAGAAFELLLGGLVIALVAAFGTMDPS